MGWTNLREQGNLFRTIARANLVIAEAVQAFCRSVDEAVVKRTEFASSQERTRSTV